ncbi:MAG TPA: 2-oxo-4-hydroxy-4-carboxy-5-ureidoimidazoline decarboxylase [Candidatus Limnocylindrales bacterium]|nr:2-oxo-4-hydroxy-4-carboxy-5-ureidoimidazoline decarboxylase [Candidatus Limnocylindrales bacterium]
MGLPSVEELNRLPAAEAGTALAPLFEGAPQYVARLAERRPFADEDDLFEAARAVARQMPEDEQVGLLDAHPRIGADPSTVSTLSRREQGYEDGGPDPQAWVADELRALNEAYEARFGFRFVVFVAGRPRADIIPILERALHADRDEELRRGLDDVVLIARERYERLRGPRPLREELREAIALEVSRWMVGETDDDGLIRATHRLIEEGVESPALLALSLAGGESGELGPAADRLMAEIGLGGWDTAQAGQLLALHAAASIIGEVSRPIDGARRIASVSGNAEFEALAERWQADEADRERLDEEIRRAAVELFGPPDDQEDEG